jgi:hypothetical protein
LAPTTVVPSLSPTTVATCRDIRTGEQTTDAERCTLPVTGDETTTLAIGACLITACGGTLLFARRGRPNHRGDIQ